MGTFAATSVFKSWSFFQPSNSFKFYLIFSTLVPSTQNKQLLQSKRNMSSDPFPKDCLSDFVDKDVVDQYRKDGFIRVDRNFLSQKYITELRQSLEHVLRGSYSLNRAPCKQPKLIKQNQTNTLGFSGNTGSTNRVLQVINIHKADKAFEKLVLSPSLGKLVCELAGWEKHGGARVAQDQVWAKPPCSKPLVFHRDSPYFMFEPAHVVTLWIALDDMLNELGPLEYVKGSHLWGDGRIGSSEIFFSSNHKKLLRSAAEKEGIEDFDSQVNIVSMENLPKGCFSVHDGRTWHGSGRNVSKDKPRRGLGVHFVPANVKWNVQQAMKSSLWCKHVEEYSRDGVAFADVDEALCPITYRV